jgi:hypothetical protein
MGYYKGITWTGRVSYPFCFDHRDFWSVHVEKWKATGFSRKERKKAADEIMKAMTRKIEKSQAAKEEEKKDSKGEGEGDRKRRRTTGPEGDGESEATGGSDPVEERSLKMFEEYVRGLDIYEMVRKSYVRRQRYLKSVGKEYDVTAFTPRKKASE